MAIKLELLKLVDEFVGQNQGSWNHNQWLGFLGKVKGEGYTIPEDQLGNLANDEKDYYEASHEGVKLIPEDRLVELCRQFLAETKGDYSEKQWLLFLSELSNLGYYSKHYVNSLIDIIKEEIRTSDGSLQQNNESYDDNTIKSDQIDLLKRSVEHLKEEISAINRINNMLHPKPDNFPVSYGDKSLLKNDAEAKLKENEAKALFQEDIGLESAKLIQNEENNSSSLLQKDTTESAIDSENIDLHVKKRQLELLKLAMDAWKAELEERSGFVKKEETRLKEQAKTISERNELLVVQESELAKVKKKLFALKDNLADKALFLESEQENFYKEQNKVQEELEKLKNREDHINDRIQEFVSEKKTLKLQKSQFVSDVERLKELRNTLDRREKSISNKEMEVAKKLTQLSKEEAAIHSLLSNLLGTGKSINNELKGN
ncbi:MAG: hypothetical protein ABIJ34_07805 [archaeon]